MKEKIFRNSFLVSLLMLLLTGIIFAYIVYDHVRDSVFAELKTEAAYAGAGIESGGEDFFECLETERRITIVDADGVVLYDNRADPALMENHLDRSEIADALRTGSGQSRHYSGTTKEQTIYYASLLSDGSVLRISAKYDSLFSVLEGLLVPAAAAIIIILLVCVFISSRLSHQITEPINTIDLNDPSDERLYRELAPLVQKLRQQNRTIKSQMDELVRKQREFAAITENMSEGLILLDSKGSVLSANRFALEALGSEEEIKSLGRDRCPEEFCRGFELALAGEKSELIFPQGERMLQLISNPVISMGQVSGVALLILDVTEREKRDELRREFSANVSHELKTPLTSISGFAELMRDGIVSADKMREFSADIYAESQRMISLVEDIMLLSRLDEGSAEPEPESVELRALCGEVIATLSDFASKNHVEVKLSGCEGELTGSRRILTEMVYNLCENAIKYNKPGGWVHIEIDRAEAGLCLAVRDSGIGIPAAHQSRVFERFYRVDKSHSKATGGTGLGLAIVRHGLKYHGASIELNSKEGIGSEFIITFPGKGE